MIMQSWNVRGLNSRTHQSAVRRLLENHNTDFLLLQETKMSLDLMSKTVNKIWRGASHMDVAAQGASGGIVTLWNSLEWSAIEHIAWRGVLTSLFRNNVTVEHVLITNFYGSQNLDGQKRQWKAVHNMRTSREDLDWIIAGDFNAKLSSRDQEGGTPFLDPGDRFMIAQVQVLHLVDIKCPGINYTWTNKR